MKCIQSWWNAPRGPWDPEGRGTSSGCATPTCCLSECIGSAVHFWNSHTQKHAVKWKTKKADFLPWKAEIPLSCSREQRQCPWPSPCASQRNGKWQWRGATIPQGHQESCSTGGLCSCNLEQPPELTPYWGAPTLDEGFSCRCLLHLNIFCGDPSCPFHTGMNILPLFPSEEVGLFFSLTIYCWRIDSYNADDHPYVGLWFPSNSMVFPRKLHKYSISGGDNFICLNIRPRTKCLCSCLPVTRKAQDLLAGQNVQ